MWLTLLPGGARTSQQLSNLRAAVKIGMAISEPPAVFIFDLFVDSNSRVSGSLLLDLFDPGTKPSFNFSFELCLIVLLLQILDGVSISI